MSIAAKLKLPVAVHAESETLTAALCSEATSRGLTRVEDYLASRPIVAELDAIRRAILFARETGCSLHIVHISSAAGSMEVVESRHLWRKDMSGPVEVTGETCPHYLLLSEDDMKLQGASAKCAPPLRSREEASKLLTQVASGGIDTIGSDHSPSPPRLKEGKNFFDAWGGIAGVQTTLRALLTLGLPPDLIATLTSENVAARFRLPGKGGIQLGHDADLALVDLSPNDLLTRGELLDRHKSSPCIGRRLRGKIIRTILRGKTVFHENAITTGPVGKFLRPLR
jgi:allantoinase